MTEILIFVGWIITFAVSVWVSGVYCLLCLNGLGKYNIGGIPNRLQKKVAIIIGIIFPLACWYVVIAGAPFTIALKG